MKQLKVVILGQGRSGRDIHANCLKNMKDMYKIIAVTDPLEERRKMAESEFECPVYENYAQMLEKHIPDLIVNASPSHMHVPITLDLLNKGFNVLCEKPLARKVEEVDSLVEASKKSGKLLAVFQQSRYAPSYQKVKEVIDSGELGRIVQISIDFNSFTRRWDWQTKQEYNGGNLLNIGPHPLDQALQLLNTDKMPDVNCIMDRANTFGDAEDYVKVILRAPGRPVIDLELSSCCTYPCCTYNVQGTNGGLKGSMFHIDWKYFIREEAPEHQYTDSPIIGDDGLPMMCSEKLKWYEKSWDLSVDNKEMNAAMRRDYYRMLYRTLAEGATLEITPEQVRLQIAVIEECHRQDRLTRGVD